MKLAFHIAKRFLFSAKKQTIVIILGIAVGVSVQVFIGALINGLQDSLIDTTIGSRSQITISKEDGFIDQYDDLIIDLTNTSSNISIVTPTLTIGAGQLSSSEESSNVVLRGFDFDSANSIYKFNQDEILIEGNLPTDPNQVALGIGLKSLLNINVNDTITYQTQENEYTFSVVGFFDFGVQEINNNWTIATLDTVQNILGQGQVVNNIEMQLNKVFDADETKDELSSILSEDYRVSTWISENEQLLSGLQGQSISSLMIQIFVIISVVLGISSVLAITVLQKSKQLGILKAMGIHDSDASKIFLLEGLILGVFGAILGILLGIGLLYAFDVFADTGIPITISFGFISLSASIAIIASTVAALSPAIKSSKLNVIEVIRNG